MTYFYSPCNCFKGFLLKLNNPLHYFLMCITTLFSFLLNAQQNENVTLYSNAPYIITEQSLGRNIIGGDTIFIDSNRVNPLKFQFIEGTAANPVVIINKGGQVKIDGVAYGAWGALTFENCKHIKVSGAGHPGFKYGFELAALQSGLAFTELSSDCEAENIKISHNGFFGIYAKKDYGGTPPVPYPVFENLIIHDCFIENVSEGMYIGETKTPGMEFKHLKIYNNIVRNTHRESIQIANAVEDVEIYNNTLINTGLEGAVYHMNNVQIGDNSVASIYNNIIMDSPDFGIINMGKGDVIVTNNFIANSKGYFTDNRTISDSLAPNELSNNYFKTVNSNEVIRNLNQMNHFTALNNVYDTDILFYNDMTGVDNETLSNNVLDSITGIQFTDPATNDYSLAAGTATEYIGMGAPGGPKFFPYDDTVDPSSQLVISADMVTDEVPGGSVFSPLFLFDEQTVDVDANEHPVSNPWKPYYTMNEASYHTVVDFGNEYKITQINLHDMHDAQEFIVEYYDGANWISLITEPLNDFNTWERYDTDVSTRYLRFSMYQSPYAAVNEIIIYGYPLVKESQQIVINSSMVTDLVNGGSVFSTDYLFDEQTADLEANEHPVSQSWKPYYNTSRAPYHAVVTLDSTYHLSKIALHDMHGVDDFIVETSADGVNWAVLFVESCNSFNTWKEHELNVVTKYVRLTMLESPYAAVNEILLFGYPVMSIASEIEVVEEPNLESQIMVTPAMVIDSVPGGSVDSPLYLFDEQTFNPEANEHPVSKSWKPFYNASNAPYHAMVDFGQEYHISKIYIHDMNSVADFVIEFDDNANWTYLLTEPCNAFKTWKLHEVDINTTKLRFTMPNSISAYANEIVFIGYPVTNQAAPQINTIDLTDQNENSKLQLFPNPVKDILNVRLPNITDSGKQQLKIVDVLGKVYYHTDFSLNGASSDVQIDVNQMIPASGLYVLIYWNDKGDQESIKFYKE